MAYYPLGQHMPVSEDEARTKFAYFRKAEESIDAGPEDYAPATPLRPRGKTPECGTHSGYKHHILSRTEPCSECRNARATYQRDYRARKRVA